MVAPIFNEMILRTMRWQNTVIQRELLLLDVGSPHARQVTKVTFYIRGFSRFVTSTIARTVHVQVGSRQFRGS
jgi:hypothetical protein